MAPENNQQTNKQSKGQYVLLLLLLLPLVGILVRFANVPGNVPSGEKAVVPAGYSSPGQTLERWVSANFPFSRTMRELALDFSYFAGQKEQGGVFITPQRLMKNITVSDYQTANANFRGIQKLALHIGEEESQQVPFFMMIPTATGVLRQKVPAYTEPINQRNLIDNTYNRLTEIIPTVDVYNTLLHNQDKYLYYRTEDNVTPIGGYYIYAQLAERMLGEPAPDRNTFEVVYQSDNYYGDLYHIAPYREISPDVLLQYHRTEPREYLVTQEEKGVLRRFHTLYPYLPKEQGENMDMYLGGLGDITQIFSSGGNQRLLLLADHTALSYVPFLAYHYKEIMVIDVNQPGLRANLSIKGYDHVLVACSVDTYLTQTGISDTLEYLLGG